jgi:nucleoside-diphosphate-sugar epimerase
MLGLAKRIKAKLLQASTSEAYGDPALQPQTEDYWGSVNPIGPRSCHNKEKHCAETLFFDYRRQRNLPIKVARPFNTYGPRMQPNDGRVVPHFIAEELNNKDITATATATAPNAIVLPCPRTRRRINMAHGYNPRRHGTGQSWKPRGIHHSRARRDDH